MTALPARQPKVRTAPRGSLPLAALVALVLVAFAVGGGGSRFGVANLAVQLAAFATLAAFPAAALAFFRQAPIALSILVLASLLLPVLQLVPLPPAIWTSLPGRELVTQSLEAAALDQAWMPISTYPLRTALALSALITPLAILAVGWSLPRHHLFNLGWVLAALGLVTVLLGSVQITTGAFLELWPEGIGMEALLGTFANRNSTGLFLVGALALTACLPAPRAHPAVVPVRMALCALILAAIILTKSRTALALSAIPVMLGITFFAFAVAQRVGSPEKKSRVTLIALAVIGLSLSGVVATAALAPGRVAETLQRFEGSRDDPRKYIWDDATYSAARYWPVGAGMGAFDDVFQVDESLENLGARRAGRVHNDFIEVTIEAGLAGVVLVAAWLLLIGWLAWRARRSPDRWAAWGATAFLLAIALQSITDYPLRSQTMLMAAGVSLLLLARASVPYPDRRSAP